MRTTVANRNRPGALERKSSPPPVKPARLLAALALVLLGNTACMTSASFERRVAAASAYVINYCLSNHDLRSALQSAVNKEVAPTTMQVICGGEAP